MAEEDENNEKGDLGLVRRGLYERDEPEDLLKRQEELHRLGITRREAGSEKDSDTLAATRYKNLAMLRAKRMGRVLRYSGVALLVVVVTVWAVVTTLWYRSRLQVTEEQINVSVSAPQEFTAGEEIVYSVSYENESRVDWENVELIFTPPRGFTLNGASEEIVEQGQQLIRSIGDLPSGEAGNLVVRGQLIGEQNETAVAGAEMLITPANFPSGRFTKTALLATTITALPLEVALDIPDDAASGERVKARVSVRNLSNQALTNVYFQVKPPVGVELAPEDEEFTAGFLEGPSEWQIPSLAPLESGEFTMVFFVIGQTGEKRTFDFVAGLRQEEEEFVQRRLTHVMSVSASEVQVEQVYNGETGPLVVSPGDLVEGEVRYSNVGTTGLRDMIIELSFEGVGLDPETLDLKAGAYDPIEKKITWTTATVPELAVVQPQDSGTIPYKFNILETATFPTEGEGSKNNVLVSTATVDSPDLPAPPGEPRRVVSDRAVMSVRTDILLTADSYYDDGRLGIESTGPIPPEVGQQTTYTVRFRAGTSLNDVSNMRLVAVLPDGVTYTGRSYLTGGDLQFNDRTGEVIWTLPFVDGLTGRAGPPHELHVQVAIIPGENTRGEGIFFLNRATLSAVDQFVDESVSASLDDFPSTITSVAERKNGEVK